MKSALKRIGRALTAAVPDKRDVLTFGGLALVGYGLSLVYVPAAYAVPGAALFYLAVWR